MKRERPLVIFPEWRTRPRVPRRQSSRRSAFDSVSLEKHIDKNVDAARLEARAT
jgi:hypothetical protein